MTYMATASTAVSVLAYHLPEDKVRVQIGANTVDLDAEARRGLAEYLTRLLPEKDEA